MRCTLSYLGQAMFEMGPNLRGVTPVRISLPQTTDIEVSNATSESMSITCFFLVHGLFRAHPVTNLHSCATKVSYKSRTQEVCLTKSPTLAHTLENPNEDGPAGRLKLPSPCRHTPKLPHDACRPASHNEGDSPNAIEEKSARALCVTGAR